MTDLFEQQLWVQDIIRATKKLFGVTSILELHCPGDIGCIDEPYECFLNETKALLASDPDRWPYIPPTALLEVRDRALAVCDRADSDTDPYEILRDIAAIVAEHAASGNSTGITADTAQEAADQAECYLFATYAVNHAGTMVMIDNLLDNVQEELDKMT